MRSPNWQRCRVVHRRRPPGCRQPPGHVPTHDRQHHRDRRDVGPRSGGSGRSRTTPWSSPMPTSQPPRGAAPPTLRSAHGRALPPASRPDLVGTAHPRSSARPGMSPASPDLSSSHRPNSSTSVEGHLADPRDPTSFPRSLRAGRTHVRAVRLPRLRRSDLAVHGGRHAAVQAVPPRPDDAAVPPRDQCAEVRAHPRHRQRRHHDAAQHLLPDGRQFLFRRLLQGGRHQARLGFW